MAQSNSNVILLPQSDTSSEDLSDDEEAEDEEDDAVHEGHEFDYDRIDDEDEFLVRNKLTSRVTTNCRSSQLLLQDFSPL